MIIGYKYKKALPRMILIKCLQYEEINFSIKIQEIHLISVNNENTRSTNQNKMPITW